MIPLARSCCFLLVTLPFVAACQDLADYSTNRDRQYAGCVVPADFVLAGVSSTTEICMTLDTGHLEDAPGTLSSSDGRFASTPLRPIPQIWKDPLSTFSFGEGRTKNLLYMATPVGDAGAGGDVTVVLSLMSGGGVEVRLLRGAPPVGGDDAGPSVASGHVFAVFPTFLQKHACDSLSASHCAPDAH